MPTYRRAFDPGGTFFFTVVTAGRRPILTTDLGRQLLRDVMNQCRSTMPFTIDAFVLLPDHLHAIWTLPEGDSDYSTRWAIIKKEFSKAWIAAGGATQPVSESKRRSRRVGVWQKRFWEHLVRRDEFDAIVAYVHFNPVKHELVRCPHEWPWSSFHRWVAEGRLKRDWLCSCEAAAPSPTFPENLEQFE
jgi:putative transposase